MTSNGIIEGYYNGSDDLGLHTSNGKIDVDIDFSQVKSSTANLLMTTSNGYVMQNFGDYTSDSDISF